MQMKPLAIVCLGFAIIGIHGERHLVCQRLDSFLSAENREEDLPQRSNSGEAVVGEKGERGDVGLEGLPGLSGHLSDEHFRILNTSIERKLHVIQALTDKVEEVSSTLDELRMRVGPKANPQSTCKLWFQDKCYWAVVKKHVTTMSAYEADAKCWSKSGHLANLYNAEEYGKIIAYLQGLIPSNENEIQVYLGMTADSWHPSMAVESQTRSVRLHNGTRATFLPWYPTYPYPYRAPSANVHLTVRSPDTRLFPGETGIQDIGPVDRVKGALCEMSTAD